MTETRRGWRGRDAGGFSLVETLLALLLVSVLVLALVNGLLTSTRSTTVSNRAQRIGAAATSFGDTLEKLTYEPCADPGWYQSKYDNLLDNEPDPGVRAEKYGTEYMDSLEVVDVDYWVNGTYAVGSESSGGFEEDCTTDGGAQRITYRVTMGSDERTGEVVKRDPQARAFIAGTTTTTLPPGASAPVARFTANPTECTAPCEIAFDGSGSFDNDGIVTRWQWDFGTGSTAEGETTNFTFGGAGSYRVKLTVTDDDEPGLKHTTSMTVRVTGTPLQVTGLHKKGSGMAGLFSHYIDLGWNPLGGVDEYEIQVHPLNFLCSDRHISVTAPAAATRVLDGSWCTIFSLIEFDVRIRARVGGTWGPWTQWVRMDW